MSQSPFWPDVQALSAHLISCGVDCELLNEFLRDALVFSTAYLAVRDTKNMDPVAYIASCVPLASNIDEVAEYPPQSLYALAFEVADAFLIGKVDPLILESLKSQGKAAMRNFAPAAIKFAMLMGTSNKKPQISLQNFISVHWPEKLAEWIYPRINKDGLVTELSPHQRKLLSALVSDEASAYQFYTPPLTPQ